MQMMPWPNERRYRTWYIQVQTHISCQENDLAGSFRLAAGGLAGLRAGRVFLFSAFQFVLRRAQDAAHEFLEPPRGLWPFVVLTFRSHPRTV